MPMCDWSSDVCSSDLTLPGVHPGPFFLANWTLMVACSPSLVQPPSCCAHDPLLAPRPRQAAAGRNLCRWNSEGQGSQGTLLNRSCCLLAGTKRAESPETILSQRWQQERQDRLHDSPQTNCKDWVPARLGRVAPHSLSVHRTTSMDDARPLLQLLLRCFLGAPVHTRPWVEDDCYLAGKL